MNKYRTRSKCVDGVEEIAKVDVLKEPVLQHVPTSLTAGLYAL